MMNSSSGSSTVTMTTGDSSLANSQQLSSSPFPSSHNRKPTPEVSKAYKHASQLFVTRRFPEALSVLEPIIAPAQQPNGSKDGYEDADSKTAIAIATTNQRIKVWSLYITLLNSIVDLGHDEGKISFGQNRYKEIVNCVRSGNIWETVVRDGYAGREGCVDAEVVYNLVTLMLGQAPSQTLTQSRLETYLASSSYPDLDITQRLDHDATHDLQSRPNGAGTPKDLASRLKILELFTLHVLPRNEEWEYAKSFISMSDVLDEERREAFLQSLQELQDVKDHDMQEETTTHQQKDAQSQERSKDTNMPDPEKFAAPKHTSGENGPVHKRTSSEIDYGIEKERPTGNTPKTQRPASFSSNAASASATGASYQSPVETPKSRNMRKSPQKRPPAYVQPLTNLFRVLQNMLRNVTNSIPSNPTTLFRMLLSVLAIIMALSRRDIRERAKRILGNGWVKVRNTIGMGVKVSYI